MLKGFILLTLLLLQTACLRIGKLTYDKLVVAETGVDPSVLFSGLTSVTDKTDTTATLQWSPHADAVAYDVFDYATGSPVLVFTMMGQASNQVQLTGLTPGRSYTFRVRLKTIDGMNDGNTNDSVTVMNLAPDVPSAVSVVSPSSADFSSTPTVRVSGVKNGDTVKLFTDPSCTTEVASQVATGSTVDLTTSTLSTGANQLYANSRNLNVSACSTVFASYTRHMCPAEYVEVPSSTPGVNSFCVMRYESRCHDPNTGTFCVASSGAPSASKTAISSETGALWVSINHDEAKTACTNLNAINSVTNKYDLISNAEWMVLAKDIEDQPANWDNNTPGTGCLFRGNNGTNDSCGYGAGSTETGTGRNVKARHVLSNGQQIWDVAGNVWEFIDWTLGGPNDKGPTTCNFSWTSLPMVNCPDLLPDQYMSQFASANGMGNIYGANPTSGATIRGGDYYDNANAGVFAIWLDLTSTEVGGNIGFRCVYRP